MTDAARNLLTIAVVLLLAGGWGCAEPAENPEAPESSESSGETGIGAEDEGQPTAQPKTRPAGTPLETVVRAGNAFAVDLHKKLAADGGNVFFSPTSIHTALAMTWAGARADTAAQMARTLRLDAPPERVHEGFGELMAELNAPRTFGDRKTYELHMANALWPGEQFPLRDDYVELLSERYRATAEALDYARSAAARKRINDWTAEQTNDKIQELIPQGLLTAATRLILTNAIYFKSQWQHTFSEGATREEPFHLPGGESVPAEMMHQTRRFRYRETEDLQVVELPYLGGDLSMFVVLPRETDGLGALERSLTGERLRRLLEMGQSARVQLTLPKFEFKIPARLKALLMEMGMRRPFTPAADFSGISPQELFIQQVLHKAFVRVDEKGTEAAAATAVIMPTAAPPTGEPKVFRADHPFLLLIRHNRTGALLFMGRVGKPEWPGTGDGADSEQS